MRGRGVRKAVRNKVKLADRLARIEERLEEHSRILENQSRVLQHHRRALEGLPDAIREAIRVGPPRVEGRRP